MKLFKLFKKKKMPAKTSSYYQTLLPEERLQALKEWYFEHKNQELNLKNPQTFNEKMQWLKLYDSIPLKTQLADKLLVRDWIKDKIGASYLIPLLGVYDSFDEIDFNALPESFVLKCNHGAGWNIIVSNKSELNLTQAKNKMDTWLKENYAFSAGFELHYKNISPKIIVEEYMNPNEAGYEFQVWTFGGEIKFVSIETIKDAPVLQRGLFYPDGTKTEFKISPQNYGELTTPPSGELLQKALDLSKKLLLNTPYVRIDFAQYKNTLKFREMTFTSGSGLSRIEPQEYNLKLGEMIKLPKQAYNIDTQEFYTPTD